MTTDRASGICATCGFEPAQWNELDTAKTLELADQFATEWGAAPLTLDLDSNPVDAVHELWHHLLGAASDRAAGPKQRGTVSQLSASSGGVPKLPVERAEVGVRGLATDSQNARVHHGRPWQALCLWSVEVITELVGEGHPIFAGAAGENVTIGGIDWATLRGGMRLTIGAVECQLSLPTVPCSNNAAWFIDRQIDRMDHDIHPGSSRWYASVIRPGAICAGNTVTLHG